MLTKVPLSKSAFVVYKLLTIEWLDYWLLDLELSESRLDWPLLGLKLSEVMLDLELSGSRLDWPLLDFKWSEVMLDLELSGSRLDGC